VPEQTEATTTSPAETENKFDALMQDRDSLRVEVTELRKSLEELQHKHREEMEALQQSLTDSETKREQAETQFQKLMERVNTIKSQLGERLKEDAVWQQTQFECLRTFYSLLFRKNSVVRGLA
jgi:chromosome segregation ATPase